MGPRVRLAGARRFLPHRYAFCRANRAPEAWPAICDGRGERIGAEKPMIKKIKELARMADLKAGQDLRAGQQGLPGAALCGARI